MFFFEKEIVKRYIIMKTTDCAGSYLEWTVQKHYIENAVYLTGNFTVVQPQ